MRYGFVFYWLTILASHLWLAIAACPFGLATYRVKQTEVECQYLRLQAASLPSPQ